MCGSSILLGGTGSERMRANRPLFIQGAQVASVSLGSLQVLVPVWLEALGTANTPDRAARHPRFHSELPAHFLQGLVALAVVASETTSHEVLPGVSAALRSRLNMIDGVRRP